MSPLRSAFRLGVFHSFMFLMVLIRVFMFLIRVVMFLIQQLGGKRKGGGGGGGAMRTVVFFFFLKCRYINGLISISFAQSPRCLTPCRRLLHKCRVPVLIKDEGRLTTEATLHQHYSFLVAAGNDPKAARRKRYIGHHCPCWDCYKWIDKDFQRRLK